MKTTMIILAALFTLNVSVLKAGNDYTGSLPSTLVMKLDLSALIPSTPVEATFEEMVPVMLLPEALAPSTPAEAEFEEMPPAIDMVALAPMMPAEADFSDATETAIDLTMLVPVTPLVADFE